MYDKLKEIANKSSILAFGVADAEDLKKHYDALPMDQTKNLHYNTYNKYINIYPIKTIKNSHKEACLAKLQYYAKNYGVGQNICGLCLKVCEPKQ